MSNEEGNKETSKFNKDLVPKLKSLAEKFSDQSRNHLLQLCLISGALSAFSMPLYISENFSPIQHVFIALSLVCFLLSIVIGILYLSFAISDEHRNTLEMIDIMEREDKKRADEFIEKHDKPLGIKKSIDLKTLLVDILFALGILFLISVIFINACPVVFKFILISR